MNFKGITWVGNVYQKFEELCLEAEEIIVQDAAKYVENQVQTASNTVKKFYSDVVKDLLPDDSVDSVRPLPGSMLHEYAPVCSVKTKRESMNRKARDVKQGQEASEGKKDGCAMECRGIDADDYYICASSRQFSNGSLYKRARLHRKQISGKEEPFQVTSPYMPKESSSLSMVPSTRVKDDIRTVSSSDSHPGKVERLISKEECQKDNIKETQHGLTMIDSVRSQESDIRAENEHSLMVADSVRSQDSDIRTANEHGHTSANSVRRQDSDTDSDTRADNEHYPMVVDSVRSQDSKIQASLATSLPSGSDDCRKENNEEDSPKTSSSSVSDKNPEIPQDLNETSVEESCILVERDEFHSVLPENKHRPYKKIRDAISSRMKQNREKEYKKLARQWYAEDVENGRECGDKPEPVEVNRSAEDSEWELL